MPAITTGSPSTSGAIMPNAPEEASTSGRIARGTLSISSSSSSQSPLWMSKSMVREALDGSVTCNRLCEKFHASHVSTVPKASSPRSARARAPSTLSSSQATLVPLK